MLTRNILFEQYNTNMISSEDGYKQLEQLRDRKTQEHLNNDIGDDRIDERKNQQELNDKQPEE